MPSFNILLICQRCLWPKYKSFRHSTSFHKLYVGHDTHVEVTVYGDCNAWTLFTPPSQNSCKLIWLHPNPIQVCLLYLRVCGHSTQSVIGWYITLYNSIILIIMIWKMLQHFIELTGKHAFAWKNSLFTSQTSTSLGSLPWSLYLSSR